MASTYSTNLRLELIGTGDQSGTWGQTNNTNLGTLLEEAIVGYSTVTINDSGTATTISLTDGATSTARKKTLELTGALTADRVLEVPAKQKEYIVYNNTTGGKNVTVMCNGQTGVVIPNGKKRHVYVDGTDVRDAVTDLPSGSTIGGQTVLTTATTTFSGTSATYTGTVTATLGFVAGLGSATAPTYTFSGDTNTGIFSPGADQIAVTVGGTTRWNATTSGVSVTGTFAVSSTATLQAVTMTSCTIGGVTIAPTSFAAALLDDTSATVARATLGLDQVDNTSDANKPVSSAVSSALAAKGNLSGGNTWSGQQVYTNIPVVSMTSGAAFFQLQAAAWSEPGGNQSSRYLCLDGAGNMGFTNSAGSLNAYSSYNGAFYAASYNSTSDAKWKDDVSTFSDGLETIEALRGVRYTDNRTGERRCGLIAQEVEGPLPEIVREDNSGKLVNYGDVVGPLVEAIKTLSAKVKALEAQVNGG